MRYISTRNKNTKVRAAQAIAQGISEEGGLFLPENLPAYSLDVIKELCGLSYQERAKRILGDFLDDFTQEELAECVDSAYNTTSFTPKEVTPIVKVADGIYSLELWHGPTCAFKDMALQILPYFLTKSVKKVAEGKKVVILVATSGDTGKAALEGFKDVEDTEIIVFYPDGGVSDVQYMQMSTQEGKNVAVLSVVGNFDDTQTTVKEIFTNDDVKVKLAKKNMMFSSANSINWGRLLPQVVYYISAYCDMCHRGEISLGEAINVVVPTGNFGNILAAYYAKQIGVPIGKLVCASNKNNVLTDFINTGVYDRHREFVLTSSPSMDILISSNLERLLYELYKDDEVISRLMSELKNNGVYEVSAEVLEKLQADFYGGFCTEENTASTINKYFKEYDYLCDTHTAVAFNVYEQYVTQSGDKTKTIVVSTANPYKFTDSMIKAIDPTAKTSGGFEDIYLLKELTGMEIPKQIEELATKPKRFTKVCKREEMQAEVCEILNIK